MAHQSPGPSTTVQPVCAWDNLLYHQPLPSAFAFAIKHLRLHLSSLSQLYRMSQFHHAQRLIGLALGIYPKLGTSLAKSAFWL
jgi:hypothetical protein